MEAISLFLFSFKNHHCPIKIPILLQILSVTKWSEESVGFYRTIIGFFNCRYECWISCATIERS